MTSKNRRENLRYGNERKGFGRRWNREEGRGGLATLYARLAGKAGHEGRRSHLLAGVFPLLPITCQSGATSYRPRIAPETPPATSWETNLGSTSPPPFSRLPSPVFLLPPPYPLVPLSSSFPSPFSLRPPISILPSPSSLLRPPHLQYRSPSNPGPLSIARVEPVMSRGAAGGVSLAA